MNLRQRRRNEKTPTEIGIKQEQSKPRKEGRKKRSEVSRRETLEAFT